MPWQACKWLIQKLEVLFAKSAASLVLGLMQNLAIKVMTEDKTESLKLGIARHIIFHMQDGDAFWNLHLNQLVRNTVCMRIWKVQLQTESWNNMFM